MKDSYYFNSGDIRHSKSTAVTVNGKSPRPTEKIRKIKFHLEDHINLKYMTMTLKYSCVNYGIDSLLLNIAVLEHNETL